MHNEQPNSRMARLKSCGAIFNLFPPRHFYFFKFWHRCKFFETSFLNEPQLEFACTVHQCPFKQTRAALARAAALARSPRITRRVPSLGRLPLSGLHKTPRTRCRRLGNHCLASVPILVASALPTHSNQAVGLAPRLCLAATRSQATLKAEAASLVLGTSRSGTLHRQSLRALDPRSRLDRA